MDYVAPEISKPSFHCPTCGVLAHMAWYYLDRGNTRRTFQEAICSHCKSTSLWAVLESETRNGVRVPSEAIMLLPDNGSAPMPELDMPEIVKIDYQEAARIAAKSPRGAAALLRLALQKLCVHLGQSGKNINDDIRELAKIGTLPPMVIKVADTIRITGNNAVHPGQMADEDLDRVSLKLFDLLNFIVKKAITEPKELNDLYESIPEGPRLHAENQDAKNKDK
nr:DUF4145 domain-containing protein [Lelliottia steviae]